MNSDQFGPAGIHLIYDSLNQHFEIVGKGFS